MGILSQIKGLFGGNNYKQVENRISSHLLEPQMTPYNFTNAINTAYRKNEIVFSGIDYIKRSISQSTVKVKNKDGEVENHIIQQLTTHPNDHMDEFQLLDIITSHLYLAGNAYLEVVWNRAGTRPLQLWPLMPHKVKIAGSLDEVVEGYLYEVDGQQYPLPKKDVIHLRFQDPADLRIGMPPIQSAFSRIDSDNESAKFVKALLENSAIPGMIIKSNDPALRDDEQRRRFEMRWKRKFGGSNRGKPAFLDEDSEIVTVGMDVDELALPELNQVSETRILSVLGVSPILIGTSIGLERSTFANYDEARRAFWEDTLIPLQKRIARAIQEQLLRQIEDDRNLEVYFDNNEVPAFEQLRSEANRHLLSEYQSGVITLNEYRQETGREDIESDEPEELDKEEEEKLVCNCGHDHENEHIKETKAWRPISDQDKRVEKARQHIADSHYTEMLKWARREFKRQQQDVEIILNKTTKAFNNNIRNEVLNEVDKLVDQWEERMANPNSDDPIFPIMEQISTDSGRSVAVELGFDPGNIDVENMRKFARENSYRFAGGVNETTVKQLRSIMDRSVADGLTIAQTRDQLMKTMSGWSEHRSEMVARTETLRATNRGTEYAYKLEGVKTKRWLTADDPCEYCAELNGKLVSVGEAFVDQGADVQGIDEETGPLNVSYEAVETPPLHPLCRCTIVAEVE